MKLMVYLWQIRYQTGEKKLGFNPKYPVNRNDI